MKRVLLICLSAVVLAGSGAASAAGRTVDILVANKDTPAYAAATAKANDDTVFAERTLSKAADRAEEILRAAPKCPRAKHPKLPPPKCDLTEDQRNLTVNIKFAAGSYEGKGGRGGFGMGEVIAPDATLRILGGYDDKFEKRAPFDTPTVLSPAGTVFAFGGKNHELKELYISGFFMDIGDGNKYDAKSNSLMKGDSASVQHITIGYLTTQRLVYADNVFLNSSHKAAAPLTRAKDDDTVVLVRNNFILNNVLAWEADSARWHKIPKDYVFEGNSFVRNWPYNPDPTTANPAALQLSGKYAANKFVIKDNLFAHNVGGAMFTTTVSDKAPPPMEITHNLFFHNGALFGEDAPGAAVMVAKFGGFKSPEIPWNTISLEVLEDEYAWKSKGNLALDPQVSVPKLEMLFADSNKVGAASTSANTVRGILGQNKQGGAVAIKDFAPRWVLLAKDLPFPAEPKAQAFGVRRDRVEQF